MQIIVGLGNPGPEYKNTRHNAGFMMLDALARKQGFNWIINHKFKAEIARDNKLLLIKPLTFVNNSGEAVMAVMSYYKLLPKILGLVRSRESDLSDMLTVVHDDIDISLGKYKISVDSRSAGHRGVESIIDYLKTKNFKRIRVGIENNKPFRMPMEKYVLQKFSAEEINILEALIPAVLNEIPADYY